MRRKIWKKCCALLILAVFILCGTVSCKNLASGHSDSTETEISQEGTVEKDGNDTETEKNVSEEKNTQAENEPTDAEEYIFPDSSTQKLTESDLESLSGEELRLARNEIYARLGRKFDDETLREYFESKSWYRGTIDPADFSEERLNETEKYNATFIAAYENRLTNGSSETTSPQEDSSGQNRASDSYDIPETRNPAGGENSNYILCSACDGLGHCPDCNNGLCPSCGGTGQMLCTSCAGLGHCLFCGGMGYSYSGVGLSFSKDPCIMCYGSGACSRCGNSRLIRCSQCGGSGQCNQCYGLYYCSHCYGNGYYYN